MAVRTLSGPIQSGSGPMPRGGFPGPAPYRQPPPPIRPPHPPQGPIAPPAGRVPAGPGMDFLPPEYEQYRGIYDTLKGQQNYEDEWGMGQRFSDLDIFEQLEKMANASRNRPVQEQQANQLERQVKADEERTQLAREKQALDQQKDLLDRQTTAALEQGRLDEAYASRQASFQVERSKRQLEMREQNMRMAEMLMSNPLLLPALMGMGGISGIMGQMGSEPSMQGPGRNMSMRGGRLPFNPAALGGADMSMSGWGRLTPDQQAFFYDLQGVPMPTQFMEGQMYGSGGNGGGMDMSFVQDMMSRASGLSQLDQASGGRRPSGKLIGQRA